MAPPFTLKLGSVDLAQYLRVGNDEGFDPYDAGGFEEPAFIDNPFGEGQGLANVDSRNREMAWPLYLNATSKDALHDLVGDINREIRYATRPLRVEWKDQDATASTFFDVEYARFDPNFRVRPSAQRWLAGVLRVWCKPYGHTGTYRTVGTSTFRGNATLAIPSLAGDASAELEVVVGASYGQNQSVSTVHHGRFITLARPGQRMFFDASSMMTDAAQSNATISAASGALGTAAMRCFTGATFGKTMRSTFSLSPSAHAGLNRLFVMHRFVANGGITARGATISVYHAGPTGIVDVHTVVSRTNVQSTPMLDSVWHTVDLGVLPKLDPEVQAATQQYVVVTEVFDRTSAATEVYEMSGAYVLPEEDTLILREHGWMTGYANATHTFSSERVIREAASAAVQRVDVLDRDVSHLTLGRLPGVTPDASQAVVVGHLPLGDSFGVPNAPVSVDVRVRERFTFAR